MENVVNRENRINSGGGPQDNLRTRTNHTQPIEPVRTAAPVTGGAGAVQVVEEEGTTGLQVLESVGLGSSSEVGLGRTEIVASLGQENVGVGLGHTPSNGNKSRLKVTIKSWNGVAVWKWLAKDDICGICRFPFHGCCTDCKFAGDDCPLVWGECTHCFHLHCIMKWLQSQQQCPMCRKEWKYLNS
jgi:anaphase-promoting complex subunit 11